MCSSHLMFERGESRGVEMQPLADIIISLFAHARVNHIAWPKYKLNRVISSIM